MKTALLALVFLIATASLFAQDPAFTAPLSASSANCTALSSCLAFDPRGTAPYAYTAVGIAITGTWAATIQFEGTIDCTTWFAVSSADASTGTNSTSTTANGAWVANVNGYCSFRARVSAYTSGTATVTLRPAVQSYAPVNNPNFTGTATIGTTVLGTGQTMDVLCSGDITTAFNAALAAWAAGTVSTIRLSAGSCIITALATLANDGASPPKQKPLRITGQGGTANGYWSAYPTGGTILDLQENNAVAKIDTRGAGMLEIDHLTIKDSGSDCAAFIQTTNTTVMLHDNAFSGTASGTSACNDVIVMGGTTTSINGLSTGAFQGYGTRIYNNYFDKIRRGAYGRVYGNAITVDHNTWSSSCGSNLTTAITAATNATPTVLTITGHGMSTGTTYYLFIAGATGSWTGINGARLATVVSANTVSIPVDATAFGALAGSPVFGSGAAIEFDGTGDTASGNNIETNLVEMVNYPKFLKCTLCVQSNITSNNLYDANTKSVMYYSFNTTSQFNRVEHGFGNDTTALWGADATSTENSVVSAHQNLPTTWAEPWRFTASGAPHIHYGAASPLGPSWVDSSNNMMQIIMGGGNLWSVGYTPSGGAFTYLAGFKYGGAGVTQLVLNGTSTNYIDSSALNVPLHLRASEIWLKGPVYINSTNTLNFNGGKGQHINFQAAASDVSGTCTFASTTCTVTFTTAFGSAPSCTANDQTAAAPVRANPSTSALVLTGGTGAGATDVVSYHCLGNPN